MTVFEFLSVAVSIVLALTLGKLVAATPHVFSRDKRDPIHAGLFLVNCFVVLNIWWFVWSLHDKTSWNFLEFLIMMGSPIALYLAAHLLVSDIPGEVRSWREHFAGVHSWYFAAILATASSRTRERCGWLEMKQTLLLDSWSSAYPIHTRYRQRPAGGSCGHPGIVVHLPDLCCLATLHFKSVSECTDDCLWPKAAIDWLLNVCFREGISLLKADIVVQCNETSASDPKQTSKRIHILRPSTADESRNMDSTRTAGWLQILGNIAIVLGLLFVGLQLYQDRQLKQADFIWSLRSSWIQTELTTLGEEPYKAIVKAAVDPKSLTDEESYILARLVAIDVMLAQNLRDLETLGVMSSTWRDRGGIVGAYVGTELGNRIIEHDIDRLGVHDRVLAEVLRAEIDKHPATSFSEWFNAVVRGES